MNEIDLLFKLIYKRLLFDKTIVKNQNCTIEIKPFENAFIKVNHSFSEKIVNFSLSYFDKERKRKIILDFKELEKLESELISRGIYEYEIQFQEI